MLEFENLVTFTSVIDMKILVLNLFDSKLTSFVFCINKISNNILNFIYYLFTFRLRKKYYQFLVEIYLLKKLLSILKNLNIFTFKYKIKSIICVLSIEYLCDHNLFDKSPILC